VIGDAAVQVAPSSHAAQTSALYFLATSTWAQMFFILSSNLCSNPVHCERWKKRKADVARSCLPSTSARNDPESRHKSAQRRPFGRHF
jgi:hypothetical protein